MKKTQIHKQSIRLLQISDTHLFGNADDCLLGLNTHDSCRAVLNHIKQYQNDKNIDFVLLTGDLSQDYSAASYVHISEMINFFKCPVYWIPGNHDSPEVMQQTFAKTFLNPAKHIVTDSWHFVLLNSHKPGSPSGYLAEKEFDYLEECFKQCPDHFGAVVLHHHPVFSNSAWLDTSILINHQDFFERLKKFKQVKVIIHGHVHQVMKGQHNHIATIAPPSTSIQFKPHCEKFTLDEVSPGYQIITFSPDGQFSNEVYRATEFTEKPNFEAKGY